MPPVANGIGPSACARAGSPSSSDPDELRRPEIVGSSAAGGAQPGRAGAVCGHPPSTADLGSPEIELEVEGDEVELELELKWSTGTEHAAPRKK